MIREIERTTMRVLSTHGTSVSAHRALRNRRLVDPNGRYDVRDVQWTTFDRPLRTADRWAVVKLR